MGFLLLRLASSGVETEVSPEATAHIIMESRIPLCEFARSIAGKITGASQKYPRF